MIIEWFPNPIYSEDLSSIFDNDYNNKIYDLALELRKNTQTGQNWNCDTWNSSKTNILDESIISDLYRVCYEHVEEFAKSFKIDKNFKLIADNEPWINVAFPGEYQEYHTHSHSHFSLVYYVKSPEKCGNIIFRRPDSFNNMLPLPIEEFNNINSETCFYIPKESNILIFRSNLIHMVNKNMSNENRVSMACNYKYERI